MIECQGLDKSFAGKHVIRDLHLQIDAGELVVLIGSSGCGKSTLLRMFNRLIEPDRGTVLFDGQPAKEMPAAQLRRQIGYVIQSTGLFPHWSVAKNVATVPKLLGWSAHDIEQRVRTVMAQMDMPYEQYAHVYPHQLSGGQAQRIGVARALAADPDVLLMDEPFAALDPLTRQSLQQLLCRFKKDNNKSIIFVTHDMEEALLLADRIAVMDEGQIVQLADPLTILTRPANEFVASFLGQSDLGLKLLDRFTVAQRLASNPMQHEDVLWQTDADGRPITMRGGLMSGETEPLVIDEQVCLQPHHTLREALSRMVWYRSRALPVVDAKGHLIATLGLAQVLARPQQRALCPEC